MTCTSHHHACDCREQKVAVLIKAALDLVLEIVAINVVVIIPKGDKESVQRVIQRTYDAIEQLGEKIGEPEAKKPCQHVFVVADECVKFGAPEEETHL